MSEPGKKKEQFFLSSKKDLVKGKEGSDELAGAIRRNASFIFRRLKKVGLLSRGVDLPNVDGDYDAEKLSEQLVSSAKGRGDKGLLIKLGEVFKRSKGFNAMVLALELFSASACFSREAELKAISVDGDTDYKKHRENERRKLVAKGFMDTDLDVKGDSITGQAVIQGVNTVEGVQVSLRENFKEGGSIIDLMKFIAEPVDLSISIPLQRNNSFGTIWRLFRGGSESLPIYKVIVDVPYEYSEDFKKASPEDKERMINEIRKGAEAVLAKIPAEFLGLPTFFKNDIVSLHKKDKPLPVNIEAVTIRGFASPEGRSKYDLETRSNENDYLSEMRAKNAADILSVILEEKGYSLATPIKYKGEGQINLTEEEERELLDIEGVDFDFSEETERLRLIHELIKRYNDHAIEESDAIKKLDTIIGGKRKVSLQLEVDGERLVFVIPGWLLWFFLVRFLPGNLPADFESRSRRRSRRPEEGR